MSLEHQIKKLIREMLACEDQEQAALLARELQTALHEHMERLRGKLVVTSRPDPKDDIKAA
jgi:hypothetical protein